MYDHFLKKKEKIKLGIFKKILFEEEAGTTSKELMLTFNVENENFRRYINELEQDLFELFENALILEKNIMSKFTIQVRNNMSYDYLIITLRSKYISENSLYKVLFAICHKNYFSMKEIADDLNFSESTVYKSLFKINEILAPFGARINLKLLYNFEGDEIGVRYFLYLTYVHLFNDSPNSFTFYSSPNEFLNYDFYKNKFGITNHLSNYQKKSLKLMGGIISYRLVYFKKTVNITDELKNDIQYFYNGNLCLNLSTYNFSEDILEEESMLFSFLSRVLIFGIDSLEEKQKIISKYQNSELQIAREIEEFMKNFKKEFSVSYTEKNFIETYFIVLCAWICLKHFKFNIDHYLTVPFEKNVDSFKLKSEYKKIEKKLVEFVDKLPNGKLLDSLGKDIYMSILYIIYEMNKKPEPLYVYTVHTVIIANPLLIRSVLSKFFSEDIIRFTDNIDQADIIISDSIEYDNSSKNYFFLENVYNLKTWDDLISFISKCVYFRNCY